MSKIKSKLHDSVAIKVIIGMLLAVLLTTSVFAATGALNKRTEEVITTEQVQDHIKDEVIRQLEAKINELLQADNSDISQKVASKLNEQAILDQLRKQIEDQISQYAGDLNFDEIDKIIEETINNILDSIINETVKVAIDNALANANIDGSFSVDEALRTSIEIEVTKQINKIIYDNVDSIITETIDKVIKGEGSTSKPTDPETPAEPTTPTNPNDSITLEKDKVVIDPSSEYNGKTLQEFLTANKTALNLVSHDTEYGLHIDNINNLITSPYHAKLKDNKLIRYDYYISFDINGEYAQTGTRDTIITENDVYTFTAQDYEEGSTIAEVIPYQVGNIPYQINLWGQTQSNEFPALVVKTYTSLDGSEQSKVEDIITLLGIKIDASSIGYDRITYKNLSWSASQAVSGRVPFVPSVYKVESESKLSYAKGVHSIKSSIEYALKDTTQTYYFAQEWDGKTSKDSVSFK